MLSEDNQFIKEPVKSLGTITAGPRTLHWALSSAVDKNSPTVVLLQLTTLLTEKGMPVSISADVLCSLTDVSLFMPFFLFSSEHFCFMSLMFSFVREWPGTG